MADILRQIDRHETVEGFVNNFFSKESARFQKDFPEAHLDNVITQITHLNNKEALSYAQGIKFIAL